MLGDPTDEGKTDIEEASMQRWHDAEQRLSTEPDISKDEPDFGLTPSIDGTEAEPDLSPENIEVGSETSQHFWAAVFLANVALGGVSIGLMLIGFRGDWQVGGVLVLVGLLAGVRVRSVYRQFRDVRADAEEGDVGGEGESDKSRKSEENESSEGESGEDDSKNENGDDEADPGEALDGRPTDTADRDR